MKKRFTYSVLLLLVVLVSSCESWLDVQPRTKVKSDDLFKTEAGFKDALIGAYTLMKSEALYGRELSYGFIDVVTGPYATWNNRVYNEVAQWKYLTSSTVRAQIDAIWCKMYNLLANVNNLLDNIDERETIFTGDNYNIIKGEALGLRAYIHFDLLRLFASAADMDKEAIPYVKTLQIEVPQVYTGKDVLRLLNEDLKNASICLEKDPIREGKMKDLSGDGFMNGRQMRINYYAVKALQARVALWSGDRDAAKAAAGEILTIADDIFPWVSTSAVSAPEDKNRDFTFSTEQIFALNVKNMRELSNTWLLTDGSSNQLYCQNYTMQQWYEIGRENAVGGDDYRVNYIMKQQETSSRDYVIRKYYQPDNYEADYAKRLPMIRRSEMAYIMAECLMGEDDDKALEYLNTVRRHRGIVADLTDITKLREELTKEYAKEFLAEGQLFYYCKRNKMSKFPYGYQTATEETVYVLPKPELEMEFGDYYSIDNVK